MQSCGSFGISEKSERKKTLQFSAPRKEAPRGDQPPYGTGAQLDSEALSLYMFTYTARETAEAGLMFYRARYLSTGIGRFVSEDPLREVVLQASKNNDLSSLPFLLRADGPKVIEAYLYSGNSPVLLKDPLGLYGTTDCSYYNSRCSQGGACSYYYCKEAPYVCRKTPTDKRSNCVRKCLQDFDKNRCAKCVLGGGPPGGSGMGVVDFVFCSPCTTIAHVICIPVCYTSITEPPPPPWAD